MVDFTTPFTWGAGGQAVTADQLKSRDKIVQMLLQRGFDPNKINHPLEGIAKGAQIALGMWMDGANERAAAEGQKSLSTIEKEMLGGGAASPAAAAPDATGATGAKAEFPGDAASLIKKFEGYRDKPYWDVNAHRVGYGSDTITNPDGSVQRVEPGMQITRQQADLDLDRRLRTEFVPHAAKAVGEKWGDLPAPAQAALTSVMYNYGRLPSSVVAAAQSGDVNGLAAAVEGLSGHNNGINAKRRMQEAAIIRGGALDQAPALAQPQAAVPPRVLAAMQMINSPFANPAQKQVATAILNKHFTTEAKTPAQIEAEQLDLQQKRLGVQQATQMNPLSVQQARLGITKTQDDIANAQQMRPLDVEGKRLANQKAQRELEGEGAVGLTTAERKAYGIPDEQPAYKTRNGEVKFGPAAPKITQSVDQKAETVESQEKAKAQVKLFNGFLDDGAEAANNQQMINELRRIGGKVSTGATAVMKERLGALGIKTEGVSDIEAYGALIDRLTPAQRIPGSGATSDFDAKMFKNSLPKLMNTPEGNAMIIDTIEKLNDNKLRRADIATRYMIGELDAKSGFQELRKLQAEARSLSDNIKSATAPKGPGAAIRAPVSVKSREEALKLPSGTPILLPDGRTGVVP